MRLWNTEPLLYQLRRFDRPPQRLMRLPGRGLAVQASNCFHDLKPTFGSMRLYRFTPALLYLASICRQTEL